MMDHSKYKQNEKYYIDLISKLLPHEYKDHHIEQGIRTTLDED